MDPLSQFDVLAPVHAGDTRLVGVRDALARHDWSTAYDLLSSDPDLDDPDWLAALADAAWWTGRLAECIEARERAYLLYDELGATREAGQCAVWLYEHHCFRARPAVGSGWLRRARRALEDDVDSVEYGNLLLREAQSAHGEGELATAESNATAAIELGRRLRSADLEAEALQAKGRILIDAGEVRDGLAHLDEAMLFAIEGRLNPYTTGKVYCSLVSACEELGDIQRANEWTDAVGEWAEAHPVSLFPGMCRVHRAGLLQWRGEWAKAELEARQGSEELQDLNLPSAAAGFVKIGEIRRSLGDYAGAEEAFRRAEELSGQAWAGLAMLRLAQGRRDTALSIITRALEETTWNRLARGKLLPAMVEITLAAGDLERARAGATELAEIAADFDSPVLLAAAATSRARVELAEGDPGGACATLHKALERWSELDVPYEVATARLLMGQACRDAGDEEGATSSFAVAETIFERLGAADRARTTRELRSGAPLPCGLSQREVEVLRLVASGRTNREIATELFLSEKTIARHISNIFTKIDVKSRAAATAFAFDNGLVER